MATYLLINCVFLAVTLLLLRVRRVNKAQVISLLALLVLTAIFDSIIIWLGIVGYNSDKILGIFIGNAPIEDFFYALFAVLVAPAIWEGLKGQKHA